MKVIYEVMLTEVSDYEERNDAPDCWADSYWDNEGDAIEEAFRLLKDDLARDFAKYSYVRVIARKLNMRGTGYNVWNDDTSKEVLFMRRSENYEE